MGDVTEAHHYRKLCQSIFRNLETCIHNHSASPASTFEFKYIPVENKEWLYLPYHCAHECAEFAQKKHVFFLFQNMYNLTEPYKIATYDLGDRRQVHMYSEYSSVPPENPFKKRKPQYKFVF